LGALHELYDRYRDRVEFLVVYIREAHPEDGWVLESNRDEGIALVDPATREAREEAAHACVLKTAIRMPTLVDGLDDEVARRYGAWPDRLYLIGRDGRIAYQSGEGPFGFKPEELEAAIERELPAR
jgi:hypothetical protein